jgi:hypothetical protein
LSCEHSYSVFAYFLRGQCEEVFAAPPLDPGIGFPVYLLFLALTCLFEWPWYRKPARVLVLNLLTHPLVVWGWPGLIRSLGGGYGAYVLAAESFAPVVEAWALHRIFGVPRLRAVVVALGANLFSWLVGGELVIRWLWPWIRA